MEGLPTTRERERSPGRGSASQPGGSPDGPERRRRRPTVQVEGQATQEEFSSPMSPGISSHRGPGTVPVEQPQQAVPPGLGGSDGGGLGAPPGYADFVTSAVRSAMEPFLQNMAPVVGEQTAQITVVNQRVEQLASVVSQMNLNSSSNVPVAGSNAANVGSPSPPRNQQSSSGLSSLSGFGERPPVSPLRNFGVPGVTTEGVPYHEGPGVAASRAEEREKDIFTKSEKWLPAMPLPDFSKWSKSRQEEILCFSEYMSQFRSWIALASDVFAFEIESAIRHPDELHMGGLKPAQQLRSSRLLAMLQQIFTPYPRAYMLIQAYVEGIGVDGIFVAHRGTSGFEALRLLGKEFSLRTRAEASFFRAEVMKRTYKAENSSTQISDVVRKMDVDLSRYRKLTDTLPVTVSREGLEIASADLTLILLRSLPGDCRSYVMLHSKDESYMELRAAAIRFEAQQRLFTELGASMTGSGRGHGVFQVQEEEFAEGEEYPEDLYVEAVGKGTSKCHRCGKAGHMQKECLTDMSQVKCFRCGQAGHIGSNCRSPKAKAKALPKAKPKAGNKGSPRKTTKGKGGGKGKKGKLNEVGEAQEGEEPEEEWAEEEQAEEEWPEESGPVSGVLLMPLFVGSVEEASDGWMYWLLDSGAACSVLAEQNKECYKRVSRGRDVSGRYLAANGTPVQMGEKVLASVLFAVERSDGTQDSQEFQLECNIGQTAHNIISTTPLMKKGWTFVQSNSGSFLVHEPTKTFIGEVLYWGSCPWIRVASDGQAGVPKTRAKKAIQAVVSGDGVVQESPEMTRHILRGHYPYDPNCIECAQGRGVGRSPRRPRRERILEIQADFFFLGRVSDKYKFILLRQVLSGLLGTTAVGPNVNVTAQQIRQILVEFGVSGSDGPPIDIRTDAATDVGELLRRSAINREFTLSRAGPQEHNVIGSAERGVREVKEAIAVVRLELAKHQLDIVDSLVGWDGICRYVVAMHNLHGKKFGKTPRELLRDSPASKENPVSAMFCSQVLAETPESVKSIGRFVTAAYLWPVRNSFAHFVVAKIEGELKYFQAKSLKLVLPLHFPDELIQRFVVSTHDGPQRKIEDYSPVEVVPSDFMKLPGRIPPPRSWVDSAGKTPGCKACDSGKGKHSVACQARYSEWLESHDVSASGSKVVVSPSPGAVEPDLLDDQQEVVGHEYVPTTPEGSDGEKAAVSHWSSHDREKRRKVEVESSPDPYFTRRCPACESGMDVPGIRHNAECRKKRASLQAQPPSSRPEGLPSSAPPAVVVPDIPAAPLPPEDLAIMDQPMLDGPAGPDEDSVAPMEFGLVDLCQCGVLFNPSSLSGLDLMSDVRFHVESIAYDGSKGECKVIDFCGSRVKLWKPSHVISDTTLGELDPEGTFKAMQKECDGLTAVKAGVILSEQKKEEFCKLHGVKPIACRWVTNEKPESDEGVRARIVVKDIARGSATARSLAISSPTPSVESLRMVLGASCGIWGAEMSLYAIDVSQAFMNSPLRDKERIVLRMPLSISTTSGEPIFLEAHKALNGLRVASLTWSVFLKDIVSKVGLACSTTEPCLYGGVIDGSPTLLLCYVDDLLIASSTDKAFHRVFKELSKHVKVRETGRIALGKDGGGSLKFLGRVISRRAGSPSLVMQVDPSYMDAACEEFGIKVPKGVVGRPDIKPNLEATSEESPISPEAHSRYRRVLGRLAWLAQTRMDLLHYTSLLASGQSEPKPGHEKALRQVLRFVATDSQVGQHFPTEDRQTHLLMGSQVIVYTDAAFAPMRVMERRSVSGAVLMYQAVTLKCFSRHQAGVSLSSCEAELHAIQAGVQESIGLSRTLAFVLKSLNIREDLAPLADLEEGESPLNIQLRTDSLSGKQLLESYDLQRRSRHIEIRLCWLRRLLNSSILELTFCRGEMNLADMFTKCVSQALFQSFRTALGFLLNDLRLSVVISGSEKQKALDDEEESESLRDLEGKPLGKTSKLTQRVFQVFQLRESFQRGRRCMLCDDVIEDDLFVEGEGEVLNSVFPSAAVVGSAASSLSGVILTEGLMASSSDKDVDRRSVREAREEAMAKEGVPDAKESKKKRRRREKKKGKTPGEESKVDKPKEDEMEEVEVEGEEPAQSSKPPVRPPPVGPPKVKKDHLKQKVEKGKKGKGKGEKGKGKDKGKGKQGKGKGEVASPSKPKSRPPEPPTPPPGHAAVVGSTSRNVMAGMGESPAKPKLDLPGSGFTKSATGRLRCDFCRKRGHIARFCPEITFRVSLTDSSIRPQKKGEKPPPQPVEEEDVAIRLKERREVRQELRQRAQEATAREALEEADRKMKEAKGYTHPVTPEEQKVLDQQRQERKDSSSYSYYTSSEDEPGEELRLVPNIEVKEDPKDPSSSESSSDDDDEGEEEELEADPDEEAREAVEENKGENSEESELFESSEAPIASGKSARASKGKPALVEAKGQKVPVQLPSRPSAGTPKAMPSTLARAETKRLADDRKEMRRLREESRALDQADAENEVGRRCGISVWLLGRPDIRRLRKRKRRRRIKESSRMSQVMKRRNRNRNVRVTD